MRLIDADLLLQKRFENGMIDGNELLVPSIDVVNAIRQAPTVDAVEVRHGTWRVHDRKGISIEGYMVCSECDVTIPNCDDDYYCLRALWFCPNCGAKMFDERGTQNEQR